MKRRATLGSRQPRFAPEFQARPLGPRCLSRVVRSYSSSGVVLILLLREADRAEECAGSGYDGDDEVCGR